MRGLQWAVICRDAVEGFTVLYLVASVVVGSKGCVKQALRRGLFWIALPILASATLAIVCPYSPAFHLECSPLTRDMWRQSST